LTGKELKEKQLSVTTKKITKSRQSIGFYRNSLENFVSSQLFVCVISVVLSGKTTEMTHTNNCFLLHKVLF